MNAPLDLKYYHFKKILTADGSFRSLFIGVNDNGKVKYKSEDDPKTAGIEIVRDIVIPGFINAHSHAFQYAMAGMAETHTRGSNDDFWSWREAMYQCALTMKPDDVQTVATALYIAMLKKGYTHVAEFHYLHHDKDGARYQNNAEMSVSLLAAAAIAGINITLIPVHYNKGGFGKDAQPRQRRFLFKSVDEYFRLLEDVKSVARNLSTANVGFGVHSLRAVDTNEIKQIAEQGPQDLPFHLHASEQLQEVDDCITHLRCRPVEWIMDNLPLRERLNIVHCTHLTNKETSQLAASKANVVLCPGTEGNLGDGIFRLTDFVKQNGNWCIGTDSHISLNPLEDLRWLDYGQRMLTHKRNTFDDGGLTMVTTAFKSGKKSVGEMNHEEFFQIDSSLDAVVYDENENLLGHSSSDQLLSRVLYTADTAAIKGTIVNGKWIIKDNSHHEDERTRTAFRNTIQAISAK